MDGGGHGWIGDVRMLFCLCKGGLLGLAMAWFRCQKEKIMRCLDGRNTFIVRYRPRR